MKVKKLSRKRHKRLDAICESEYSRIHSGKGRVEASDFNEAGDDKERRRSSRVRKAPVLLDTSPPPKKKRGKIDGGSRVSIVGQGRGEGGVKAESSCSLVRDFEEGEGGWRSRLRSRRRSGGSQVRELEGSSPEGKMKSSGNFEVMKEELILDARDNDDVQAEMVGGKTTVVKSKRPGRINASNVLGNEFHQTELEGHVEDDEESSDKEATEVRDEGVSLLLSDSELGAYKKEIDFDAPSPLADVDINKSEVEVNIQLEKCPVSVATANGVPQAVMQPEECQELDKLEITGQDMLAEDQACTGSEEQKKAMEVDESIVYSDKEGDFDKLLVNEPIQKLKKKNYHLDGPPGKLQIKEGRRCGLCGTGSDGKPPKILVQDGAGSDNEAYSGSSSSEEPNYDLWDGFGDEPGWLGRLLGPVNDRHGIAGIWVHQQCAVWSPEVYFAGLGCLKNVRAALCRGRVLKCTRCGRPGATIGCRVDRCPRTYHLPCARDSGCIFDHRKFLIACTDHRYLFQPHGSQYIDRIKKMKVKKLKLEMRKMTNDAWRRDVEAEEKWLENCGEDEEFLKRESKRLQRDLLRIAPTYIGGSSGSKEMQFEGWDSVAGLQNVIQCLKEVVILPLLYPEYFNNLGLTPPRGVLLHGYPGTGKTLVVRALIGSCARGDKRIAYFARKGADCLGKYVGDAERQLRLLFQVAEKSQPSIIFFDEIDGLAPCRTPQQDQTHSSVVSTLLALMDGLKSRGSVVVIGATNRPDAIDPALRRPGRFDREIYFPLPSVEDREAILSLHTRIWPKPISGSLLKWIAMKTVGYAGADLQALCTQAAIFALRRSFPFQEILSTAASKALKGERPPLPSVIVEERDWLQAFSSAPPPCSRREAGIASNGLLSSPLHTYLAPCLLQPLCAMLVSLYRDERVWLPPPLSRAAKLIEKVIVSALETKKLDTNNWWSHAPKLLEESHITIQIEDGLRIAGIILGDTCVGSNGMSGVDNSDDHLEVEPSIVQCARPGLLQNISYASRKKLGFHLLISGNPKSGQRHLSACLLHYFVCNVEVQKVDLATMSQEGHGDMVLGLTQVLMRCASLHYSVIFMPRIDLWAMEVCNQEYNSFLTDHGSSQERACNRPTEVDAGGHLCPSFEFDNTVTNPSYLWNLFVEQVESISTNSSLTVLATSEVQLSELPSRIRQFFESEITRDKLSTTRGNSVPQYSVEVDGCFDVGRVIDSCSAKISMDLAQHFVQMVHYKNHIQVTSFKKDNVSDVFEGNVDATCPCVDPDSVTGPEDKESPVTAVSGSSLRNISVKGKPSLLAAISIFGYQILLYPHFAELCWVTSKLKEGPSANIRGPWKGWPFNSCIVRPIESSETEAAAPAHDTTKIKEKSSIVRGLIAVGLSAYRGEYTSLREVASEVRTVLELFVGLINGKIQSGKDRYRYIRVMSQVAYLEDMVHSWVHTLQRLEADARPVEADRCVAYKPSMADESACKSCPSEGKQTSNEILHESAVQEENAQKFDANSIETIGNFKTVPEHRVQEGDKKQMLDNSIPAAHQSSVPVNSEHCTEASRDDKEAGQDSVALKHLNGSAEMYSVNLIKNEICGSGDKCRDQFCSFQPENGASLDGNNFPPEYITQKTKEYAVDSCHASGSTGPLHSDIICSYNGCSECFANLNLLVKEILNHWQHTENHTAVEEVHDFVSRLSSKLHSAIWRLSLPENSRHLKETKTDQAECMACCQKVGLSNCISPGQVSMECHQPMKDSVSTETKKLPCGLQSVFIFRNGVLITSDTNPDISFHCRCETLCLCSLVEWIRMSKESLM